ncbi:hypothetical protein GCM10010278_11720 [Streptomyces melanogenes]|nr:hypothetical protein GCM10010278_11720 [Streptomyces melanogenes]
MTTFHMSEQTHPVVLPQRQALEPVSADNLGGEDETGHRRSAGGRVTGVGHGRGETPGCGTRDRERHPDVPAAAGAGGEKAGGDARIQAVGAGAARVFVLDRRGCP